MKMTTLTNLMLFASLTLFTACSNKTPKPAKETPVKLTTLEIMGIDTSISPSIAVNENTALPMARTYPMEAIRANNYIQNYLTVASNVEDNAKSLLGIKYVWGATGPSTYDCSGFTQKIYRDAGINIPRVSREQARVGQYVSFNSLRRGDMVFFDTKKKQSGKVTHVGIYLGNNNFIHASSSAKKIVIFNFSEKPYYKKRFLWGRRVIKDNYYMASL